MSDIELFRVRGPKATKLPAKSSGLEKPLQTLIENNLKELLGVRFLASEYSTGKTHAGRIDTLGLDENSCPVILEYKRSVGENVINQGLFYLDWLMDHKAEFAMLVLTQFDKKSAYAIDWSSPRLICIASDFTKYDGHAVAQMHHSIELIRYKQFGTDLLLLELVNASSGTTDIGKGPKKPSKKAPGSTESADKTVVQWFATMPDGQRSLFESLERFVTSLGDDVQRKDLKLYVAFKRLRNFVTVCFKKGAMYVYLSLDPKSVVLEKGFSRDVSQLGHWGTGDVELLIQSHDDLDKAKPLIQKAYES